MLNIIIRATSCQRVTTHLDVLGQTSIELFNITSLSVVMHQSLSGVPLSFIKCAVFIFHALLCTVNPIRCFVWTCICLRLQVVKGLSVNKHVFSESISCSSV